MKGRMDAPGAWIDRAAEVAKISADQLGKLAILDDQTRQAGAKVLAVFFGRELFKHLNIGRETRFRSFARLQTQLLEKDLGQLTGRVEVELAVGKLLDFVS